MRRMYRQRLHMAGSTGEEIFEPDAIEAVHRHAGGIPRITNLLCEHALITAFVGHSKTVSAKMVDEVARDFDLQEPDRQSAPKGANGSGHPILVEPPVPQNQKASSISLTKVAGEKKN